MNVAWVIRQRLVTVIGARPLQAGLLVAAFIAKLSYYAFGADSG